MEVRKISYMDGDVLLEATVACETGGKKRPVIFIFHAWDGKDSFVEQKAIELAKLGYVGCALDLYGKGVLGRDRGECAALMEPLFSDRLKLQKRILASKALFSLIPEADEKNVGAIGFCFGGLCALDLARSGFPVKGVVSFHGLLENCPSIDKKSITGKIIIFHGYKDPMVVPESLLSFAKEMEEKEADFQLHVFGKAMHAFTNPKANDEAFGTVYNQDADNRSWEGMKLFFKEIFG